MCVGMCALIYTFLESRMRVVRLFSLTTFRKSGRIHIAGTILYSYFAVANG